MLEVLTRARRNDTVMRNMPSYEAQINKANLAEQEKPSVSTLQDIIKCIAR